MISVVIYVLSSSSRCRVCELYLRPVLISVLFAVTVVSSGGVTITVTWDEFDTSPVASVEPSVTEYDPAVVNTIDPFSSGVTNPPFTK